jgi:hypothetical protein
MWLKKFAVLLTTFAILISQSITAEEGEKIYISPGLAFIGEDCIYVQIDNKFIPVASLSMDESGVYVCSKEMREFQWQCPKCGLWNFKTAYKCSRCGYEK